MDDGVIVAADARTVANRSRRVEEGRSGGGQRKKAETARHAPANSAAAAASSTGKGIETGRCRCRRRC